MRTLGGLAVLGAIALGAACSTDSGVDRTDGSGASNGAGASSASGGSGAGSSTGGTLNVGGSLGSGGTAPIGDFEIAPLDSVIDYASGDALPTVQFTATSGGASVDAVWFVDRLEIGTIDATSGLFTATGNVAGVVNVTARYGNLEATTTITVNIAASQNGDDGEATSGGPGGLGGVGGEGQGIALNDGTRALLDGAATADAALVALYPYDGTVWPRGLLAPLLQWKNGAHPAQAIRIKIQSGAYSYTGYFGRPSALGSSAAFQRHPIPQGAWYGATYSNPGPGNDMSLELVVLGDDGVVYGPITWSWPIAAGSLKGTVFYQSYMTNLALNSPAKSAWGEWFGGATLAIKSKATAPELVAGTSSETSGSTDPDSSGCRVCHVVSADGSTLISQHGDDYGRSSLYDLKNGYAETAFPDTAAYDKNFAWAGLYPDGSLALSNSGMPMADQDWAPSAASSRLFSLPDGAEVTTSGLTDFVTQAATPSFSPDGAHVAFNFYSGAGGAGITATKTLVAMDFDRATSAFSNPRALYTEGSARSPAWPSFLPTNDAVVFGVTEIITTSMSGDYYPDRRGQLWWADMNGNAHALDQANGTGYLPNAFTGHDEDDDWQSQPTVAPIVAGGYAWIVFTSHRAYGNVATRTPGHANAYGEDFSEGNPDGPTTKKLWVAAIDIPPTPGSDPSHPAFYLPAQELYAGNTRGFWTLDPCKQSGETCETGDECCGGFCRPGEDGAPVCGEKPTIDACSREYEACNSAADCCQDDPAIDCISGHCALPLVVK